MVNSNYSIYSKETIIYEIGEANVYHKYLGIEPDLRKKFHSPFSNERTPSFCFFVRNSRLLCKCFSSGEGGDCISVVMKLFSISFMEAVKKIIDDFNLNISAEAPAKMYFKRFDNIISKAPSDIKVAIRDFYISDIDYWNRFYITKSHLEKWNIKACSDVYIEDRIFYKNNENSPCYRYRCNGRIKVYQPFEKDKKWRTNFDSEKDLLGFDMLPQHGDDLIITKSYKDVIPIVEYANIPSVTLASEAKIPPVPMINHLQHRFKNITFIYDNDDPGKKYLNKIKEVYPDFKYTFMPCSDSKDPSGFIENYGISSFIGEIFNCIV